MSRKYLPTRRPVTTTTVMWRDHLFDLTIGFYDEEMLHPGEVFANSGKTPEAVQQLVQDACVLISVALQHGIPPEALGRSIPHFDNGKAYTIIGMICDILTQITKGENGG